MIRFLTCISCVCRLMNKLDAELSNYINQLVVFSHSELNKKQLIQFLSSFLDLKNSFMVSELDDKQ